MALKIWLPLCGNTHNQGYYPTEGTSNNATVNSSGKIGSCYSFSGSQSISLPGTILPSNTPSWSFCCWFYLADTNSSIMCFFSERTGANQLGYDIFFYPNTGRFLVDDGNGARWDITPRTFSSATWYHLIITRNPQEKRMYINGELVASNGPVGTTTSVNTNGCLIGLAQSSSSLTTGNQGFRGRLNDVRIYDHCLSPAEAHEVAQGLVLHYKFDQVNSEVIDSSGYHHHATITGTSTVDLESSRYTQGLKMNNRNSSNHIAINEPLTLPTTNISASFWVKADKTVSQVIFADPLFEFGILNNYAYVHSASSIAGFSLTNFTSNAWNHIAIVKTGSSTYIVYINGQVASQNGSSSRYIHDGEYLWLLNRNRDTNYGANASISDFRIYCTQLLDNDVKMLYNMSMKIDNSGCLHTFEYIEDEENEKLTRTGVVKTNELEEYSILQAKLQKEKGWYSSNFIET